MKVEIVTRDHRETFKDIEDQYESAVEAIGKPYFEVEEPIDDFYATFISDSKDIYKLKSDDLIDVYNATGDIDTPLDFKDMDDLKDQLERLYGEL